uniref:Anion exchange protein n=1 Tax=Strigamia maritima TaxID=126957 RepID=T1IXB9_STRMM
AKFTLSERISIIRNYDGEDAHPVYSELEELQINHGDYEWRQTARWLRFEEHVEQGGKRWSKPYVATLPLHAVFETRACLKSGDIMLDVGANSLEELAEVIVDHLVNSNQLEKEYKSKVKNLLLKRHHHLHEERISEEDFENDATKCISLRIKKDKKKFQVCGIAKFDPNLNHPAFSITTEEKKSEQLLLKGNQRFRRKMPDDVEAAALLVGELHFIDTPLVTFVRLKHGVQLGDLTEVTIPTRFVLLLLGPKGNINTFRDISRTFGAALSDEVFREIAYKARNRHDLITGLDEFIQSVTIIPASEWDPRIRIDPPDTIPSQESRKFPNKYEDEIDSEEEAEMIRRQTGLVRTGRLFGGLIDDVKRKLPWYWSDFKDAMAIQSVAAILFLFFATLSPIITFGGLLDMATDGNIAVIESLVSGFISGVLYGLLSGQPLTILNTTGPVLVFEAVTYTFCQDHNLNYLEFRCWIGIWTFVIMIFLVMFECSAYVCYITRFTEENFALLIAMVYIYQAIEKMILIAYDSPMQTHINRNNNNSIEKCQTANISDWISEQQNSTWISEQNSTNINSTVATCNETKYVPDVLLLSIIEFIGTFFFVIFLKAFRTSSFFPFKVRQILSDFAVVIAIAVFTIMDDSLGIATLKLFVPESFTPTRLDRGWFIHPTMYNPWWCIPLTILPAMLATILIFMDQMITAVIINRKENKLKKGPGYHLDLLVLAFLILINSFVGVPWLVAGTVVAITHVNALKMESEVVSPGEKPQFLGLRENRLTQITIFVLIGASVGMAKMLTYIPMPVLFGVFMYMGTSPLQAMHFFQRLLLFITPVKYQPDFPYLRFVRLWRVHIFTLIQLICMILMWIVKLTKSISISFPFMLVVMVIVRKGLDYVFTYEELKQLDDLLPGTSLKLKRDLEYGKRPLKVTILFFFQ